MRHNKFYFTVIQLIKKTNYSLIYLVNNTIKLKYISFFIKLKNYFLN